MVVLVCIDFVLIFFLLVLVLISALVVVSLFRFVVIFGVPLDLFRFVALSFAVVFFVSLVCLFLLFLLVFYGSCCLLGVSRIVSFDVSSCCLVRLVVRLLVRLVFLSDVSF